MNVLAFILALVGAVLNLFMPFISIPNIIDVNVASIYSMIFSAWDKLKDSPINGLGDFLLILLIMSILLAPINAFLASFDVLFRKKQTFFFKSFQYSPSVSFIWFAITSCIVALALGAISEALVQDFLKQAPRYLRSAARREISEYLNYYVPLIWAACYGLAAMFTRVDEQNQKAHQEQLDKMNEILAGQKSQPAVSPENPKITENIVKPETTKTEKTYEPVLGVETEALIKRANIFLEDEDFDEADRYFEQALNQDPENSNAYIGKLLVAKKVHNIDELLNLPVNLADEKLFQRALKFADGEEKNRLEEYVQAINAKAEELERIEREKAELAKAEEAELEQQRKEVVYNADYKGAPEKELEQAGVPPMFEDMYKMKMSQGENNISSSADEVQEITQESKTKTGIISVVALVLIVGGILYYSGVFSNESQSRRVSSNSTSSTTTPSTQSVERTSNTENQPIKTKTEEASEYYRAGEKVYKEKNYQKAFENFTKAAELGNGEAQFHLARMYHEGEGVEKNLERTLYWMNKAYTTKPNYRNKFMLGIVLYEGEDYKRAFPLLKEVAEIQEKDETGSTYTLEVVLGNLSPQMITHAQMLIGVMYAGGNGVERDYNQAEYWLKKSIEGGNEDNQAKKLLNAIQSEMRSQTITQPTNIERDIPDMSRELDELAMEFVKRENIPPSIVANGEIFVLRSYTSQFKAIDGDTAYIFSAPDTNSQAIFKLENGAKLIADAEYTTKDYGAEWYYVHFGNKAKGWVLSSYVVDREPDDNSSSTNHSGRQAKVNGEIIIKTKSGGNVNVRSEPSTNSEIVGKAESGMRCSITRRATDEKGYTWYFVEEDYSLGVYGWVRGDLCKVVRISNE